MVDKHTWKEFRETGLVVIINQILHIFGWAIVCEVDEETGIVLQAYPARVKFRGFSESCTTKAYANISKYILDNSRDLYTEATNGGDQDDSKSRKEM